MSVARKDKKFFKKRKKMTGEEKRKEGKGERVNGEARPAAGAAVFGACRAELAVTVCTTGRKRRGGGVKLKTRIHNCRKGKEKEKKNKEEKKC